MFKIKDSHILFTATGCYSGYSPYVPGTAGSLAAIPVCLIFMLMPHWLHAVCLAALIPFSFWVCDRAASIIGKEDPGCIVLDEFVGMIITMSGVKIGFLHIAAGFILFRIFDIIKPWPLRKLEKGFAGGAGIVTDDIGAGIYSSIILNILILIGII